MSNTDTAHAPSPPLCLRAYHQRGARLNERFGLRLDERDQLLFDQLEQGWIDDGESRQVLMDLYAGRVYRKARASA